MSSRGDYRRRDRSRERERERERDRPSRGERNGRGGNYRDEPRRRSSRSRSPRRGDRDRRYDSDRRDYGRDRDRDHGERRRDDRDDYKRDDRRDRGARDDRREPRDAPRSDTTKPPPPKRDEPPSHGQDSRQTVTPPHNDNDTPNPESMDGVEDGEAPEVADDDAAMMAMMGMAGFGSTKGKHVEGNQEGGVNVKKIRTWRQYMNRRGGFNRPLDKIK